MKKTKIAFSLLVLMGLLTASCEKQYKTKPEEDNSENKHFEVVTTTIFNTSNYYGYSSQSVSDYRTSNNIDIGEIIIIDDYIGVHTINLYHSDAPNSIFDSWTVYESESVYLNYNNEKIIIGSDWGIQIVFGNGVESEINFVGDVSTYKLD